jgi:NAD(P)H-hydrate epimerase
MNIPTLTTAQMIEVDRLMIEEYGIDLLQMMENAGRSLADLAWRLTGGSFKGKALCVLCGRGNNGGGGMAAARHLHNRGARVHLIRLAGELKKATDHQWNSLQALGLRNDPYFELAQADLILDALIGYGLQGDPRPEAAVWIEKSNASGVPILALDAPSGLDATSGQAGQPTVRAEATLTLALPKTGLVIESARDHTGTLFLGDIGVPRELYERMGLEVGTIFEKDTIIQIRE